MFHVNLRRVFWAEPHTGRKRINALGHDRKRNERISYGQITERVGLTREAAHAEARRRRRWYRELLHEEFACTLGDLADLNEEIKSLFASLEN
jgi:hypothetical protein